jgi:hypothetical protein
VDRSYGHVMRTRFLAIGATVVVVATMAASIRAAGQARPAAPAKGPLPLPRTADGHPDLTGVYDLATLTPVERPNGVPAVLTDEEAAKLEGQAAARRELLSRPSKTDRDAPPVGGDGSVGAAGNVGGYNNFWIDAGSSYVQIDGQKRSSLVIDPADGRVPAMTAAARQRLLANRNARPTSDAAENGNDPGFEGAGAYDDPERRPLGERCLLGFGSTSGPPVLPNYFYNNLHQIVQTRDSVMILTEMVHDARVVRMNAPHLPNHIRKWMGDSVGSWEGDTLVVDTTNFSDKTRFRGSTADLHVVERFSRIDEKTLRYRFTVEDPNTWTQPWTGEYTWPATDDHVYEYACHEANYALENILRGARVKEADEAGKKTQK